MDIQDIFKKIFFWTKTVGIQFSNTRNWKSKLLNWLLIWNIFLTTLHVLVRGYHIIFSVKDIHELAECIPTYISVCDLLIKLVNFHVQRKRGIELIDSLTKFMKAGMFQSVTA
jgi:hypothetical protein